MEQVALVDALDHLLNRGAIVVGESTISLANVDLVYLQVSLLLSSVETLRETALIGSGTTVLPNLGQASSKSDRAPIAQSQAAGSPKASPLPPSPQGKNARNERTLAGTSYTPPPYFETRANGDPAAQRPESSLAQLVLTLAELLRRLVERQAVRRMAGGGLPEQQVEEMGLALMELENQMARMREVFNLTEEDIQLDLGPLGRLL